MSKHTELPWRAVGDTGIRNDGGYIVFSKAKPFHYPGQDERYEREIQEWHGNLDYIALACNNHEDLLAICKKIKTASDATPEDCHEFLSALDDCWDELEAAIEKATP